ncbi:sugar phosphate isomerase/epimerase [Microvirga sp. VF16]|uniref:sugar phosphate isomerase/epimerase family protein n=1 Tax=Microvirga sp. VF16 TaxID=2807101 RepID=UPI00193D72E4|nr:sugar phosphate isomerase/epimerase family protein [Microvirga sp. VF16]QRM34159.1 sugar phosphate isomerase/epimerase [Microvirga sp. VF16]
MTQHVLGTGISATPGKPDLSEFAQNLDQAQAFGVDTIELPIFDLDLVVGGRIRRDQLAALKAICAGRDVIYTVHGPLAINLFDAPFRNQRHFEVLQASLEIAGELGAIHYVMHSGLIGVTQNEGIEEAYTRQREWLVRAGNIAKQHNVILCVENLFGGHEGKVHTASPSRLARELAAVGHSHVMATLDFSHAYLDLSFTGGDLVSECAALAPFAKHLHVHDSFGRQDDIWMFTQGERLAYGHGDLHLPVGWGDIPWDALMASCIFPHNVVFNIELQDRYWHVGQDCVDATKVLAAKARTALAAAA